MGVALPEGTAWATRIAHGVGNRQDLPLPFWAALAGAVVALVASFLLLGNRWRDPRLRGGAAGRPLRPGSAHLLDAAWFRWVLSGIGLLLTGYFLLGLLAGPDDAANPSAGVVYVLLWVGTLVFASALLGPVWRMLNPLRTLHLLGCRVLVHDPTRGLFQAPKRLGLWPAAAVVFSFGWLELVAPDRASTGVLTVYLGLYAIWVLGGAMVFGSSWIGQADGFEVVSTLYGRLSILGRRDDGTLVLRSPLNGLAGLPARTGAAATVCVLLAITAYDGFSSSPWWIARIQGTAWSTEVLATLALLAMTLLVGATYGAATWLSGRLSDVPGLDRRMPRLLAHSVVPIALGYAIAHYFSLLIVVGQQTAVRLSDPLGTGANWLGMGNIEVNYSLVGATTIAALQVLAVVGGHILGITLAHDRTVALVPKPRAVRAQLPVLILMVFFTLAGLTLLFSA